VLLNLGLIEEVGRGGIDRETGAVWHVSDLPGGARALPRSGSYRRFRMPEPGQCGACCLDAERKCTERAWYTQAIWVDSVLVIGETGNPCSEW